MSEDVKLHRLTTPFVTENGFTFEKPEVAYQTWGELNENRSNVVIIFHALTGNAEADDWFGGLFKPEGILDPSRQYIVCMNVLGSCYGTTGPWSTNPETGKPWRGDFPKVTIRDMIRLQQQVLDQWEINEIELVLGGSMGGMQALEFAIMDQRARRAVLMAMGKNHTPWAIGLSHSQRQAIYGDPKWQDGFYDLDDGPEHGLSVARMIAMISYRSPADFEDKFGRELQPDSSQFQIESYLDYQGKKLSGRFDALTYVRLTQAMDSHDVSRGRGTYEDVLGRIDIPVLVLGIDSDTLYPINEQKELAELIPNGQYAELTSPHGHDAFLIEFEEINELIHSFLKKNKHLQKV